MVLQGVAGKIQKWEGEEMFAGKKLSKAINPDSHCSAPYLCIVQLVGCSFSFIFCGKPDSPEPSAANM